MHVGSFTCAILPWRHQRTARMRGLRREAWTRTKSAAATRVYIRTPILEPLGRARARDGGALCDVGAREIAAGRAATGRAWVATTCINQRIDGRVTDCSGFVKLAFGVGGTSSPNKALHQQQLRASRARSRRPHVAGMFGERNTTGQ
jgi:cell wall-associated NlpC family hydrolase